MNVSPEALCQIEIHSTQLDRSKVFYEQVFGWKAVPAEIHNYVVLGVPRECRWGIALVPTTGPVKPSGQIVLYFQVDDPELVASLAERHGGAKKFGPTKLPAYGSIWHITDPDGHRFGLFKKQEVEQDKNRLS
jgi:predicted enzyme related to lactoylglutathione lyase